MSDRDMYTARELAMGEIDPPDPSEYMDTDEPHDHEFTDEFCMVYHLDHLGNPKPACRRCATCHSWIPTASE